MAVYVHLATGFEEIEALTCVDYMRRGGIEVETVSVTGEMKVVGSHGVGIEADILFEAADYNSCPMIVLPGGMPGAVNLRDHEGLKKQIQAFATDSDKKLAAICASPLVLAAHGVLEGKNATIYPGMEDMLEGAVVTNAGVTVDGNIITGMGPALASEFALTIVEIIKGKETREEVESGLLIDRL